MCLEITSVGKQITFKGMLFSVSGHANDHLRAGCSACPMDAAYKLNKNP